MCGLSTPFMPLAARLIGYLACARDLTRTVRSERFHSVAARSHEHRDDWNWASRPIMRTSRR